MAASRATALDARRGERLTRASAGTSGRPTMSVPSVLDYLNQHDLNAKLQRCVNDAVQARVPEPCSFMVSSPNLPLPA